MHKHKIESNNTLVGAKTQESRNPESQNKKRETCLPSTQNAHDQRPSRQVKNGLPKWKNRNKATRKRKKQALFVPEEAG